MSARTNGKDWSEKLSELFMDVAKYVLTGVILSSLWTDIMQKWVVYVLAFAILAICLFASYIIDMKNKERR